MADSVTQCSVVLLQVEKYVRVIRNFGRRRRSPDPCSCARCGTCRVGASMAVKETPGFFRRVRSEEEEGSREERGGGRFKGGARRRKFQAQGDLEPRGAGETRRLRAEL
jgi:hypothetical protein